MGERSGRLAGSVRIRNLAAGGFLFFPWTTLIYALVYKNGLSLLNLIFLACALAVDLGTWGIGFFAGRKEYSSYRDA